MAVFFLLLFFFVTLAKPHCSVLFPCNRLIPWALVFLSVASQEVLRPANLVPQSNLQVQEVHQKCAIPLQVKTHSIQLLLHRHPDKLRAADRSGIYSERLFFFLLNFQVNASPLSTELFSIIPSRCERLMVEAVLRPFVSTGVSITQFTNIYRNEIKQ